MLLLGLSSIQSTHTMELIKQHLISKVAEEYLVLSAEDEAKIRRAYRSRVSINEANKVRSRVQQETQKRFTAAIDQEDYATIFNMLNYDKIITEYLQNTYVADARKFINYNALVQAINFEEKSIKDIWEVTKALRLDTLLEECNITPAHFDQYLDTNQIIAAIDFTNKTVDAQKIIQAVNFDEILKDHEIYKIFKKYINTEILCEAVNFNDSTKPFINTNILQRAINWNEVLFLETHQESIIQSINKIAENIAKLLQNIIKSGVNKSAEAFSEVASSASQLASKASPSVVTVSALLIGGGVLLAGRHYLNNRPQSILVPASNRQATTSTSSRATQNEQSADSSTNQAPSQSLLDRFRSYFIRKIQNNN